MSIHKNFFMIAKLFSRTLYYIFRTFFHEENSCQYCFIRLFDLVERLFMGIVIRGKTERMRCQKLRVQQNNTRVHNNNSCNLDNETHISK